MLLVCMKCVNCSILFLRPSMFNCSMFMLCVLVCGLLYGCGCGGLLGGGGGGVGLGLSLVSPMWLSVWCVSVWKGWEIS